MKKLLALMVCLSLSMFAIGCGGEKKADPKKDPKAPAAADEKKPAADEKKPAADEKKPAADDKAPAAPGGDAK